MVNVFLMGDSICLGYYRYVKEAFWGLAKLWCYPDNGRFTTYQLKYLNDWLEPIKKEGNVDVVHFNSGLWDCLRIDGDEPLIDVHTYKKNVERLINRIRNNNPSVSIIIATTTKVIDERMSKNFCRKNADIKIYNAGAVEVAHNKGIEIDDLYCVTSEDDFVEHDDDGIHFTECGYRCIADKVFDSIIEILRKKDKLWRKMTMSFLTTKKIDFEEYNRIVVYGYGEYGMYVIWQLYEYCGYRRPVCVIDQNHQKHGITPEGVPIISLDEYNRLGLTGDVVIVSLTDMKQAEIVNDKLGVLGIPIYGMYEFQYWLLRLRGVL